jgi:invasion protein IalB
VPFLEATIDDVELRGRAYRADQPGQNGQDANTPKVCFTGRDARTETGVPVVATALIEPDGNGKKIFRVTVPNGVQLQHGTRIIVDTDQPFTAQFLICLNNSCMSDYEATPELIAKLKKGQTLSIQAINVSGKPISFPVPLADFAKVNEGPQWIRRRSRINKKSCRRACRRHVEIAIDMR